MTKTPTNTTQPTCQHCGRSDGKVNFVAIATRRAVVQAHLHQRCEVQFIETLDRSEAR